MPQDGEKNGGSSPDDTPPCIGASLLGGADLSQFDESADGDDVVQALGMRANLLGDEAEAKARETSAEEASSSAKAAPGAMDGVKEAIDTFLLYDFFVILFILAWLVVGVGVRLSKGNGLSYDEPFLGTWLFLWPFLFQPLLGVHMLATLVSPAVGWAAKRGIVSEDAWR